MEINLLNKRILLTGALGGIARSIVDRLLDVGAFVVLTDLTPPDEAAVVLERWKDHQARWVYHPMDVNDPESINCIVAEVFSTYPEINVALGHAGGCPLHPFTDTNREEFDRIVHFNFLSQTYFSRAILKEWAERKTPGHMVFTSSWASTMPWKTIPAYCAAKAAVNMFAKCLALEYAEYGIRFNIVSPGNVAVGSSLKVYQEDENYRTTIDRISPMGCNSPEAIGDAFLFLCSDFAKEINGHILQVDLGVGLPKLD